MTEQPYIHPAFPQPDDPAAVIWRYMDAPKFEWLVNCGRLFMPSADRLGDPLEGSTPLGELEWWRREIANAQTEETRRIIEDNRALLSRMAQQFRDHYYYVACWHMNQHENHAMWGCYTKQPESVAVRTTYAALREILPAYVEMGVVRYIDYDTGHLPTMNMFEYIMHKDTYYAFEREVRAVAVPPPVDKLGLADFSKNLFESETTEGFRIYAPPVDIKKLIHSTILPRKLPTLMSRRFATFAPETAYRHRNYRGGPTNLSSKRAVARMEPSRNAGPEHPN